MGDETYISCCSSRTWISCGVVATMGNELTDEDGKHIHHLLALAMTKSFALYSMEKAGENQKYLIENVTKK